MYRYIPTYRTLEINIKEKEKLYYSIILNLFVIDKRYIIISNQIDRQTLKKKTRIEITLTLCILMIKTIVMFISHNY